MATKKLVLVFQSLLFILVFRLPAVNCYRIKDQIIPKDYDKNEAPATDGQPVDVYITMHVINFRLFKEKDLSFTMDIFLHMNWKDPRLRINWLNKPDLTLSSAFMKEIWLPDVYFKNGITGHIHTGQFNTGYFILNKTEDYNGCRVFLASSWGQFRISKRVYNPDFHLANPSPRDCTSAYPIGTYSCVRGRVELTRLVRRHFARKYTPSFLIVSTAFVGFWIPVGSHPARVAILVISLLALITQQVQSQPVRSVHMISYNLWANICIGLVFLSLLEFALAIFYDERNKNKKNPTTMPGATENGDASAPTSIRSRLMTVYRHWTSNCNLIDQISKVLFPLFFFLFIVFYSLFVKFRE